ncbi:TetR/AcrR family transcriptional regulator [Methanobrevibacter millerae]|uniref:Transcriptional regulator, TetR family n=1 Tax=Methanobrevibacter millerae TaxID=230361 RepID=A0A1G5W4H7_9EURY|nr:TetR/AcrR family transcriptional regulator [Methanobrevibacter millerae]SDA52970.1 transcriptional regulator, TetR family [Methanobrevibacter millerae]
MNTKDLILEKTLKLILDKGTIDISISEIRNSTELTTGGIYYHFSDKSDIFEAIMQKYMVDYIKIDFDKIILEGSSRKKIHDALFYILHHFINGVEIESINEKINYRSVMYLLTATGYAEDEVYSIISQTGKDIRTFLTDLVEDGKRQNEIRQDFPTKNIVESLFTLYMGIQSFWLTFENYDAELILEKNFNITWQAIECQN